MTKEQMADQTTERKTALQSEREVVDFISLRIEGLSDSMAHFSVSPTPDALLAVQEAALVAESDEAIAKALSAIEVTDPNFSKLDLSGEGISDAYAITLAKAKVAEAEIDDARTKDALRNFRDRILKSAGRAVAGIGGKKALTATAGLSLVAAACGPLINPQPQETPNAPRSTPTESAEATEVVPTPTRTPTSTPEEAGNLYQLEDGTQMERVEQGQLVELFPGSEVFMSERGDAVIINKETGLELAGQIIETDYGTYTLLFGKSYSQNLHDFYYLDHFRVGGEPTKLGSYPNISESPLKAEIGRILSTLMELRSKEVGFNDLSTHQPNKKNLIAIYMNIGTSSIIESSLQEGLLNIDELKKISNGELAFPAEELGPDTLLLVRFMLSRGISAGPARSPEEGLHIHLVKSTINNLFTTLMREAATANGMDWKFLLEGYNGVKGSAFSELFASGEIDASYAAFAYPNLDYEKAKWGVPNIVEVDFGSIG